MLPHFIYPMEPTTYAKNVMFGVLTSFRAVFLHSPARRYLWPMRASILDTNFGVWLFISCSIPGLNSRHRFIPASLPTVEPKSLNGSPKDRLQYGREAVSAATEVSARSR